MTSSKSEIPKLVRMAFLTRKFWKDNTIYSLSLSADEDYKTHDIVTTMTIRFKSSTSDQYKLTFVKQSDGDFLLAKKGDD